MVSTPAGRPGSAAGNWKPIAFGCLAALAAVAALFIVMAPHAQAATGGPDSGQYRYIDSLEAGGPAPAASWAAIAGTEIRSSLACDDSLQVTLPWSFDFYGVSYSSVWINENGWVSFETPPTDSGYGASTVQAVPIPNAATPNRYVAGLFADLDVTGRAGQTYPSCVYSNNQAVGSIQYGTDGSDFVVQWTGVPIFDDCIGTCSATTPAKVTLQIRLHSDAVPTANSIFVVLKVAAYQPYGSGASGGINADTATSVGIEEDGTTTGGSNHGLAYFYQDIGSDTPVSLSGRVIKFFRNTPPTALAPATPVTVNEDCSATPSTSGCATPAPLTLQGSDPDGGSLTFCLVTAPTQGMLTTAPPLCPAQSAAVATTGAVPTASFAAAYRPNANVCNDGSASFPADSLSFRVKDPYASSATAATVQIRITCVPDAPATTPSTLTVLQDANATSLTLAATDPDVAFIGDSLSYCVLAPPAHGNLSTWSACPVFGPAAGSYQPEAGYCNSDGPADSFTFTVQDATAPTPLQANGTVTLVVTCPTPPPPPPPPPPPADNRAPVATFSAAPTAAHQGDVVSFVDGSKDPDAGDAVSAWRWSFGDGALSSDRSPSHVYGTVGVYQACLTVWDRYGLSSKAWCLPVQVTGPEAGQQAPPAEQAPALDGQPAEQTGDATVPQRLDVWIDGPTAAAPGTQVTLTAHTQGAASFAWQAQHGSATLETAGDSVTFTAPAEGEFVYLAVTATSASGSGTAARMVSSHAEAAAVTIAIEGPATGVGGQTVTLDASSSAAAGPAGRVPMTFHWTQTSGPAATLTGADSPRVTITLADATGTVTFLVAVDAGSGPTTQSHTISVAAQSAGTGHGAGDASSGAAGFAVSVDGLSARFVPDVAAASYTWEFGDGTTATTTGVATHTYAAPGSFTVRLTAAGQTYAHDATAETADRPAGELASSSGGASMPVWLPYAVAGFLAAFLAVGWLLLVRQRRIA